MLLKIEDKEWDEFFIENIAEIVSGKDIYDAERFSGRTPYISSTAKNNGVGHFVGNKNNTLEDNCLSVNRNGSVGYSFYHSYKGLFSNDCRKLRPKFKSEYVGLFLSNQVSCQREKYNYGYKMGTGRLKRQKIMLPIDENGKPDYPFMDKYVNNLINNKKNEYIEHCHKELAELEFKEVCTLEDKEWREFFISELFDVQIGKNIDGNKVDKCSGMYPYITRKEVHNGNDGFLDYDQEYLFKDTPVITIGNETASPFVQIYTFFTGTKVNILKPKNVIQEKALFFIAQSLRQHKDKYSFSYTINSTRLKRQMILLPVAEDGTPDYKYMAQYMMNLEYRKRKQYIEFLYSQSKSCDK
ncbi:restriction endonuclease subunit S [Xenorhabdus indica]|uniref:restriction endonuclease subunit S n=1 Tax=Xenorhabdus indica TaxID=333964 RepID=UPI001656CFC5|nr:restriction endonuclease subunit S [Xenorhabdus indica]MBC8945395.1 Restriction enzyme BgcI subunit beta [Xenorhabdus indica]